MRIGWIGMTECFIILFLLVIVAGLAFRSGYFRGRNQRD